MAFLGRFGNMVRQAMSRKISSELCVTPSIFQAIRCMSNAQTPSTKLFIGGVSYNTDEQSLREIFSKYGEVVDARIIMDRETGRSRGFGFVTFTSVEEASSAIQAMDGKDLHGRWIKVNFANERPRGFGGGGFGGNYDNAPYGGGAGSGYLGRYGNSSYSAAAASNGGGYGGNPASGYGSGGNFEGNAYGDNYAADNSYGIGSSGGSGLNNGNVAGFAGGNTYNSVTNGANYGCTTTTSGGYGSHDPASGFGASDNYDNATGFGDGANNVSNASS